MTNSAFMGPAPMKKYLDKEPIYRYINKNKKGGKMKTFRELAMKTVNEGTSATITVFDGKNYKTSYLQYDAYVEFAGKVLLEKYWKLKDAKKLVEKSGELRSIDPLEYYTDRTLLDITKNEKDAIKNSNEMHIKYYFSEDTDWLYNKGRISEFEDMIMVEDVI